MSSDRTTEASTVHTTRWSRGSEWRKWDLHFHTPSSFDYQNKSVTNEEIVRVLKSSGICAVAVTDHHTIDTVRLGAIQREAGDALTVFPGIELRTELGGAEAVHIIGIFPEDAELEHIWTTLQGQLNLTDAAIKTKGDDKIYVDFREAAKLIRSLGGLVSVHAGKKSNSIERISNAYAFKQAVKEDIAKEFVDLLELGQPADARDYEEKVFPDIGRLFPMVIGSDNHNAKNYTLKIPTWIRCDPTFQGLRQILNEPTDRVYRGDTPPILKRVAENKTKYINGVTIRKLPKSTLSEIWFDCEVPLNPGLIAIIGNKGSGKSALTDIIGLVGETRQCSSFSFLNTDKFRQPKNNKARHFEASLSWENGLATTKQLDADTDVTAVETVKYIPQSHLETVCNELRGGGESRFDAELKSVIFSHVPEASRIDAESLDELIEYRTKETYGSIELLRSELHAVNEEIVDFEQMLAPEFKERLQAQLAQKKKELEAHDAIEPAQIKKPDLDPKKQAEMAALTQQIERVQAELAKLEDSRRALREEQKKLTRRVAVAEKLLSKIENFKKQHQLFLSDVESQFAELGVAADDVVRVTIDTSAIAEIRDLSVEASAALTRQLDETVEDSIASSIATQKTSLAVLQEQLDAPNQEYQRYLISRAEWIAGRAEILGDAETPGTYKHLEARLAALNDIPAKLSEARKRRIAKAEEILNAIQTLVMVYRTLYKPVQDFIENHPLARQGFHLDFQVRIVDSGFERGFFGFINQQRRGSFCGIEEGRQVLKELLQRTDWNDAESVLKFLNDVLVRLSRDHRQKVPPQMKINDQLRREGVSLNELYDFLFGLSWLKPKYNLQWDGRELDELSPGERGTVLLLFYLLVDSNDVPLVIDQPEENLDNQTVFNILVPAVKEARNRRQIIIVTHNPNLAVVCDADEIIYSHLDKKGGNRVTYTSGAIENPTMNRKIIDVLEGTRPAFDNRDSKYRQPGTG